MCKATNDQNRHFQGVANKVPVRECARVFCECQRVCQEPCPAFPSLLQLIPARPGPRSLAQLPRGSGRVPIIQEAPGSFLGRLQDPGVLPSQLPGMCPAEAQAKAINECVWLNFSFPYSNLFYTFWLHPPS